MKSSPNSWLLLHVILFGMENRQERAFELRRSGKSYREIQKDLGVSLSTLSAWLGKERWSQEIGTRLLSEHIRKNTTKVLEMGTLNGKTLQKIYAQARQMAEGEYPKLMQNRVFCAALVLYWAQGDKTSKGLVRLSSKNPSKIRLFRRFLREVCLIPEGKVSCGLTLEKGANELEAKAFWAQTGILEQRFGKTTFRSTRSPVLNDKGLCSVAVSSRFFKEKMLVWLRLIETETFA